MPGVSVETATRSGPATSDSAPIATFFAAGLAERGPTDKAVLARSLNDFEQSFGERVSYGHLHDAVRTFFEEGGGRVYGVRVVGPAATTGDVSINDRTPTTPQPTLRLRAIGAGVWSADVSVTVSNEVVAGSFRIVVEYGDITETYINLTSVAEAVNVINNRSYLVTASDLGSTGSDPIPAVGTYSLSAGTDDRAAIAGVDYVNALNAHAPSQLGAGVAAVPGQTIGTIGTALVAHCVTTRRLAILAPAKGTTVQDAIDAAQNFAANKNSEYAGLFYPWVSIPDGPVNRFIPPESYVAAVRARAHETEGPWRAPGGQIAATRFVNGVETEINRSTGDQLDSLNVNAIRVIRGTPRLYGWRSLSSDVNNYSLLTARDVLNYLVVQAEADLEQYVFRTIDSRRRLFGEVEAELIGIVEPIRIAGGLYELLSEAGEQIDPGYAVNLGPSVNTAETLQRNEINAEVGVRVSPTGALIKVIITKVGLTDAL